MDSATEKQEATPAKPGAGLNPLLTRSSKFLVFQLGEERFAIPLFMVREVIAMVNITPVPKVPGFFKGIINLRGRIISVMDLRAKLGLDAIEYQPKKTCIVIAEVAGLTLGAIVDEVLEVAKFLPENIESDLDIQGRFASDFIIGAAKKGEQLTLILDIGKTLSVDELQALRRKDPR